MLMGQNSCIEIQSEHHVGNLYANHLNYAGFLFNYALHRALFYFAFNAEVRNYPLLLSFN